LDGAGEVGRLHWTGILIATATLMSVHTTSGAIWLSVAVGAGSFVMVQASRLPWISVAPAIVFGFAMTVGTIAATGNPITTTGLSHPALVAATTALVGAGFGLASELGAAVLFPRVRQDHQPGGPTRVAAVVKNRLGYGDLAIVRGRSD
jgi:hypothetical protein